MYLKYLVSESFKLVVNNGNLVIASWVITNETQEFQYTVMSVRIREVREEDFWNIKTFLLFMYEESDLLNKLLKNKRKKKPILLKCIFPILPKNLFINLYDKWKR